MGPTVVKKQRGGFLKRAAAANARAKSLVEQARVAAVEAVEAADEAYAQGFALIERGKQLQGTAMDEQGAALSLLTQIS